MSCVVSDQCSGPTRPHLEGLVRRPLLENQRSQKETMAWASSAERGAREISSTKKRPRGIGLSLKALPDGNSELKFRARSSIKMLKSQEARREP